MAEDKKPIEANELRLTTITGWVTAILAPIGAVVATFIETLTEQPPLTFVGILGLVAVLVLAFALIASADILARARVTAAKARSSASNESESTIPTQEPVQKSSLSTTGTSFEVHVGRLSSGPVRVLALRWDENTSTVEYLVGEPDAGLAWVREDEMRGLSFPA